MKNLLVFLIFSTSIPPGSQYLNIKLSNTLNFTNLTTTNPDNSSTTTLSSITSTIDSSSTTKISTVSTIAPTTAKPTSTKPLNHIFPEYFNQIKRHQSSIDYYCSCDLTNNCDINCCCDIDCTNLMLKKFECNEDETNLLDFNYKQGLTSCKVNDGWFCVFKDNTKVEKPLYYTRNLEENQKNSWPSFVPDNVQSSRHIEYYKFGDTLQMYSKLTDQINNLDLPFSFFNPHCQIMEPIRYLVDFHRNCLTNIEKSQKFIRSFQEKISSSIVMHQPKEHSDEITLERDGIKINLDFCGNQQTEKSCQKLKMNNDLLDLKSSTGIKIEIYHNFTAFVKFVTFIYLKDTDYSDETIWQTIETKFIAFNDTKFNISGPLGYKIGLPVIQTKLIRLNETQEDSPKILEYFAPNRTIQNSFIYLPVGSGSGNCHNALETINFEENLLQQCQIDLGNVTDTSATTNYTEFCNNLQQKILNTIFQNDNLTLASLVNTDYYISEYGRPVNVTAKWKRLVLRNINLIEITGSYNKDLSTILCRNIIISFKYEFSIAKLSVSKIPHQNLIKSAQLIFEEPVNLEFTITETFNVPVRVSVKFYDLTQYSNSTGNLISLVKKLIAINLFIIIYELLS